MTDCNFCLNNPSFCIKKIRKNDDSIDQLQFNEGELIFDEEQQLRGIYCIKKGVCKISKMSTNGKEQIIHFLKEGTLLGIRCLLNGEATNLKARALTPVEVCFVSKKSFFETIEKDQNFLNHLLVTFADYLRSTDDRIVIMGQSKMVERLSNFLLKLHSEFGVNEQGCLNLYIKREDIASYIGVTTESIIRMLKALEQKGLIQLNGKSMRISDLEGLQNVSRGFTI